MMATTTQEGSAVRLSRYVFRVDLPHGSHCLLVHGLTGAIVEVDATTAGHVLPPESAVRNPVAAGFVQIESLRNRSNPPSIQRFDAEAVTSREEEVDLLGRLRSAGFESFATELETNGFTTELSPAEEERKLRGQIQEIGGRMTEHPLNSFWIAPTYDCQLRCKYCFMFHPSSGVARELEVKKVMSLELADAAFDAMAAIQPNPVRRILRLFGGDPLQRQHAEVVRHILRKAESLSYRTAITSNCVDLDAFIDELSPSFITSIQVVFDGPQHIHDQRRIRTRDNPTFETIVNNISLALQKGLKILARIQVDRSTLEYLPELAETLEDLKLFDYPNFSAGITVLHPHDLSQEVLYEFLDAQRRLHPALRRMENSHSRKKQLVVPLLLGKETPKQVTFCGKQNGLYIFDALGRIYDCPETLGYVDQAIGEYGSDGLKLYRERIDVARGRLVSEIPECMACPFVLMCGGGCEISSRNYKPGAMLPYRPACDGFQEAIKGEIRGTYRKLMAAQVAFRTQTSVKDSTDSPSAVGAKV